MTTAHGHGAAAAVPQFVLAGLFLEGPTAQDLTQHDGMLAPAARLRAALPPGLRERTGAEVIAGQSAARFGGTGGFELAQPVGEVGGHLHLRWRLRLQARQLGAGWFTVGQQATPAPATRPHRPPRPALRRYRPEGNAGGLDRYRTPAKEEARNGQV